MGELEIKGTDKYIKYLSKHLIKEHPSTKKRMKIELDKGKKYNKIINEIVKKVSGKPKLKKLLTKEFQESLLKGKTLKSYSTKTKSVKGKIVHDIHLNWK